MRPRRAATRSRTAQEPSGCVVTGAGFESWNAGDMDAVRETLDPDVIVQTVGNRPEPGPYVGREAFMRFVEQLRRTWDADAMRHGVGHGPQSNMEFTLRASAGKNTESHGLRMGATFQACTRPTAREEPVQVP